MLYNQTFMSKEDYLSYSNKLLLLREEVQIHLDNLKLWKKIIQKNIYLFKKISN